MEIIILKNFKNHFPHLIFQFKQQKETYSFQISINSSPNN